MRHYLPLALALLLPALGNADGLPDWAKGRSTLERQGDKLSVFCLGSGLSLDLAREKAQSSCQAAALSQLAAPITVKAESVQTEKDAAFHESVRQAFQVRNLHCQPEREAIEKGPEGFTVYTRCLYDLGRASVADESAKKPNSTSEESRSKSLPSLATNEGELSEPTQTDVVKGGSYKRSNSRHVMVSAVPACESILIVSATSSRIVRCESNPQTVRVEIGVDQRLVVRPKGKNYLPKTIELKDRAPASERMEVEVFFDEAR